MFFLAVIAGLLMVMDSISGLKQLGLSKWLYFPILCAIASAIVAYAFPKPSFKVAFLKLFAGGLITFLIFLGLTLTLGAAVFAAVLDTLWSGGGLAWSRASGEGVVAGIIAVFVYAMITIVIVGILFACIFALTNFVVLLVMNAYVDRNAPPVAANAAAPEVQAAPSPDDSSPTAPRGEDPFT